MDACEVAAVGKRSRPTEDQLACRAPQVADSQEAVPLDKALKKTWSYQSLRCVERKARYLEGWAVRHSRVALFLWPEDSRPF